MRVLVEQTERSAKGFIDRLVDAGLLDHRVPVHVLMGGEAEDDWDIHPEQEAILIGTQDMLLSRALNRGYAASRSRWPMQFGLLHTDCLWVFDEIQLMGAGLATTTQLEAFRRSLPAGTADAARPGHGCRSVWMSATMQKDWLGTVDFQGLLDEAPELLFDYESELRAEALPETARAHLEKRWVAKKKLVKAGATMANSPVLAAEILDSHRRACSARKTGTRTIVVVNTVRRACELFDALEAITGSSKEPVRKGRRKSIEGSPAVTEGAIEPTPVLLHSRFRPSDREDRVKEALKDLSGAGTIIVSTQVIEAGVDVSASVLFTELAPWAALVQRFGRCNRAGEDGEAAMVYWIDLPGGKKAGDVAAPYEVKDLELSRKRLEDLQDVGLKSLPTVELPFEHIHVVRRRDLVDLFDTTPDLAGNDIDIDRFVREVEEGSDVRVFWREWGQPRGHKAPPDDLSAPFHRELCPAPIGGKENPGFREFAKVHRGRVWRWSFLEKKWAPCDPAAVTPGHVYLVHSAAGGYDPKRGWNPSSEDGVPVLAEAGSGQAGDGTDDDRYSRGVWQTVATHTSDVRCELEKILAELETTTAEAEALRLAALWHDRGKAHAAFQNAIDDGQTERRRNETVSRRQRPDGWAGCRLVAKAPGGFWRRYDWAAGGRRHFRHELVSALAVLDPRNSHVCDDLRDLVAYLAAAHHGKVRISIRSLPGETRAGGERRFARGVWDGDEIPETPLDGLVAPAVTLSLEAMELGLCEEPPFEGLPSWAERMLNLRDTLGPFRLAYLEAITRAADIRASRAAAVSAEGAAR